MTLAIFVASMNWFTQSPTWPGRPPRSCFDHCSTSPTIAGATRCESSRSFWVAMSYRVTRPGRPLGIAGVERGRRGDDRRPQCQYPACPDRDLAHHGVPRHRDRIGGRDPSSSVPWIARAAVERRPIQVQGAHGWPSLAALDEIIQRSGRVNNSLPTRRPSVGYVPAHDGPGAQKGAPASRADPGTALVPGRALTPLHQPARAGPEVADRGHAVPDLRCAPGPGGGHRRAGGCREEAEAGP